MWLNKFIDSVASRDVIEDDKPEEESIFEVFGGNIDNAYWGGVDDGAVYFARHLKELMELEEEDLKVLVDCFIKKES